MSDGHRPDPSEDARLVARALERLEDCREPESFRSWLLAIVRNRATDLTRASDRSRQEPLDELGPSEIERRLEERLDERRRRRSGERADSARGGR